MGLYIQELPQAAIDLIRKEFPDAVVSKIMDQSKIRGGKEADYCFMSASIGGSEFAVPLYFYHTDFRRLKDFGITRDGLVMDEVQRKLKVLQDARLASATK